MGGGTGIYSIACLEHHPNLRAIVWDRPEVLKVADEMARRHGVADRLELRPGDMFADAVPGDCDAMLVSNILHDWDVPENQRLIDRLAAATAAVGMLAIHDVFLNDADDGPLPIALYSAALFRLPKVGPIAAGVSWMAQRGRPRAAADRTDADSLWRAAGDQS